MTTVLRRTVLALGLCSLSAPAFAHAHLKSSIPADGMTASAPTELDLTFSEGVNLAFTGVKLTGPDKASVATGAATFGAGGDATLVVPIPGSLGAGTYTVDWHALATDGHKTTGRYRFTVRP